LCTCVHDDVTTYNFHSSGVSLCDEAHIFIQHNKISREPQNKD
jgi:hypothetical protein